MALLTVTCVTINALNPEGLAAFWAELVGGIPHDAGNNYVIVNAGEGRVPLLFQRSEDTDPARGWVHLDCDADDRDATIARITELGGHLVEHRSDSNGDWVVMADPEGNPFCI